MGIFSSRLLRVPKVRMVIVLLLLSLVAIVQNFSFDLVFRLITILGVTLLAEFLLWKIRNVDPFLPSAGVVTALIIFLLSDPTVLIYLPILAAIFAVSGKQLFRFGLRPGGGGHALNPAAAGLFVTSYFGNVISWWGANSGILTFLIILLGASFVSIKMMRQGRIVLSFLVTTFLLSFILARGGYLALAQLRIGAFWFFALVMLPEPMTAAHFPKSKLLYGSLVGLFSYFLARVPIILDPLLASLLLGNASFKVIERYWKN